MIRGKFYDTYKSNYTISKQKRFTYIWNILPLCNYAFSWARGAPAMLSMLLQGYNSPVGLAGNRDQNAKGIFNFGVDTVVRNTEMVSTKHARVWCMKYFNVSEPSQYLLYGWIHACLFLCACQRHSFFPVCGRCMWIDAYRSLFGDHRYRDNLRLRPIAFPISRSLSLPFAKKDKF